MCRHTRRQKKALKGAGKWSGWRVEIRDGETGERYKPVEERTYQYAIIKKPCGCREVFLSNAPKEIQDEWRAVTAMLTAAGLKRPTAKGMMYVSG